MDLVPCDDELISALWELAWAGRITSDTFAPVRALIAGGHTAHRQRPEPARLRPARAGRYGRAAGPGLGAARRGGAPPVGRGAVVRAAGGRGTHHRSPALAELFLDRYGVVTRGSVMGTFRAGSR